MELQLDLLRPSKSERLKPDLLKLLLHGKGQNLDLLKSVNITSQTNLSKIFQFDEKHISNLAGMPLHAERDIYHKSDSPRAPRMEADQRVSPANAGKKSIAPQTLPNRACSGSSIVTYSASRILRAKNRPPVGKIRWMS